MKYLPIASLFVALVTLGLVTNTLFGQPPSTQTAPPVGAVSGDTINSNHFGIGGQDQYYYRQSFTQATTTICAIKSPNATSTLVFGLATFSVSSTTATTVTFARATTAFATTTIIGAQIAIAANAQMSAVASTTSTTGGSTVFPPNTWFVMGMQGNGGSNTFSPQGYCSADFQVF